MANKARHRRSRPSNDQVKVQAALEHDRDSGPSTRRRGRPTTGKEGVNGGAGADDITKIDGDHSVSEDPATGTSPTVIEIQEPSTTKRATRLEAEASQAWAKCAEEVWRREEATVQMWKDQISTLLTFAGLFSAALTAFNVQYYGYLLPQTPEASIQLLTAIHGQLSILAAHSGETDLRTTTTILTADSKSSAVQSVPGHIVLVNICWFSALVFSLSAASLAISVIEWLLHHTDRSASMSRQSVRVWYFRHRGIEKWHVPFIISLLSVFLQISLALFVIGLIDLLWSVNTTVGTVITTFAATLLGPQILMTFIPAWAPNCPWKTSPALWWFKLLQFLERLLAPVERQIDNWCQTISQSDIPSSHEGINNRITRGIHAILCFWRDSLRYHPKLSNWREFDHYFVAAGIERSEDNLAMLLQADAALIDDDILAEIVRPCFAGNDPSVAFSAFLKIIRRRVPVDVRDDGTDSLNLLASQWSSSTRNSRLVNALGGVALDMALTTASAGDEQNSFHHRSLGLVKTLLCAMQDLESANSLYSQIWVSLSRTDVQTDVWVNVESLAWQYHCDVHYQNRDAQSMLSCANAVCKDLDLKPVPWYDRTVQKTLRYNESQHWYLVAQAMERLVVEAMSTIVATNIQDFNYDPSFGLLRDLLQATGHAGLKSTTISRLLDLITATDVPPKVQDLTSRLMLKYESTFNMELEDVHRFLVYLPKCETLGLEVFAQFSESALFHASKLSRQDFVIMRDEIQGALATIAAYFNRPENKDTTTGMWPVLMLSKRYIDLAKKDISLMLPHVLEAWQSFLAYSDARRWIPETKRNIQRLKTMVESEQPSNSIAADPPVSQSGSSSVA